MSEYGQAKKQTQAEKDILYEKYALHKLPVKEYRRKAKELTERLSSLSISEEEAVQKLAGLEKEYQKAEEDMKQIIRYSHIEVLTQEVVDTFIKKIYAYRDRRVEIEWNFSADTGIRQAKIT